MKEKIILLLSLFAAPFFLFAQKTGQPSDHVRTYSPAENLTIQKGELDNFNYMLLRLDNALEDGDQESVNVLKQALLDLMKNEIDQAGTPKDSNGQVRLKRQKELFQTLSKASFSVEAGWVEKSKAGKDLFGEFSRLMEEELSSLETGK